MNKWNMHNPTSVQENDTHKFLWDFNIKMDHLISSQQKKKKKKKKRENLQNCQLYCPGWPQNKTERIWKDWLVPRPW